MITLSNERELVVSFSTGVFCANNEEEDASSDNNIGNPMFRIVR